MRRSRSFWLAFIAWLLALAGPATAAAASYTPTTSYGADYSTYRPTLRQLNDPGIGGPYVGWVARYIGSGSASKRLTAAEAAWLRHDGVWKGIVLISEAHADEARGGCAAGQRQAQDAAADKVRLGAPAEAPVILAVDYDLRDMNLLKSYMDCAARKIPKSLLGVYGSLRVVNAAYGFGYRWNMQTYAWSGGRWAAPNVAPLRQIHNGALWHGRGDLDIQVGHFPFWGPGDALDGRVIGSPVQPVKRPVANPAPVKITTGYVVVHKGDTLSGIARKYHVNWRSLARLNRIRNPDRIYPGQRIKLH